MSAIATLNVLALVGMFLASWLAFTAGWQQGVAWERRRHQ